MFSIMRSRNIYRPKIDDPKNCLDFEGLKYLKGVQKLDKMDKYKDEILDIKEHLINFRLPCYKYNYSLDPET